MTRTLDEAIEERLAELEEEREAERRRKAAWARKVAAIEAKVAEMTKETFARDKNLVIDDVLAQHTEEYREGVHRLQISIPFGEPETGPLVELNPSVEYRTEPETIKLLGPEAWIGRPASTNMRSSQIFDSFVDAAIYALARDEKIVEKAA